MFPPFWITSCSLSGILSTMLHRTWLSAILRTHSLVISSFNACRLVGWVSFYSCIFIQLHPQSSILQLHPWKMASHLAASCWLTGYFVIGMLLFIHVPNEKFLSEDCDFLSHIAWRITLPSPTNWMGVAWNSKWWHAQGHRHRIFSYTVAIQVVEKGPLK